MLAVSGTPTAATHWFEGAVRVTVTVADGQLSITNATGCALPPELIKCRQFVDAVWEIRGNAAIDRTFVVDEPSELLQKLSARTASSVQG